MPSASRAAPWNSYTWAQLGCQKCGDSPSKNEDDPDPCCARKLATASPGRASTGFKRAGFERNLVVIDGGSAGLVTTAFATAIKTKVTLVEKHKLGGDGLHTACVPSKALIHSATNDRRMCKPPRDLACRPRRPISISPTSWCGYSG